MHPGTLDDPGDGPAATIPLRRRGAGGPGDPRSRSDARDAEARAAQPGRGAPAVTAASPVALDPWTPTDDDILPRAGGRRRRRRR